MYIFVCWCISLCMCVCTADGWRWDESSERRQSFVCYTRERSRASEANEDSDVCYGLRKTSTDVFMSWRLPGSQRESPSSQRATPDLQTKTSSKKERERENQKRKRESERKKTTRKRRVPRCRRQSLSDSLSLSLSSSAFCIYLIYLWSSDC